jgi:hypothetical protein
MVLGVDVGDAVGVDVTVAVGAAGVAVGIRVDVAVAFGVEAAVQLTEKRSRHVARRWNIFRSDMTHLPSE